MGFSYNKAMALKPQKERWLSTFMFALLAAAVMFAPFCIQSGGYFTFYGDFNVQQIPFYKLCHEAVRSGNFGWNNYTDLGSDLINSYSFYLLGSPFFWLTVLFPTELVPYLMAPLLVIKFACAALTAYFFIRRFTRTPEAARLGGLLYAFCGFSIYNIFFNHFHEAIIVFPLLLLSLELLITENKHGLFAACVFLCAVTNYYFFFGMVVFCLIYYIIRTTSGAVKVPFGRFCLIALEAVIGLCASAAILLPTVMSLIQNPRVTEFLNGWNAVMYGKEQIYLNIIECFFFPPDLPARPIFFPGAEVKWSSLGGWLPVFGMIGVFAFCGRNKGSWIKRVICTSLVFAFFPILNSSFSAFTQSYYARWFYMPILVMCLATVMAMEDREQQFGSAVKWTAFITLAFTLVIGFFPRKTEQGIAFGLFNEAYKSSMYTTRFWTSCAIAIVSVIIAAIMLLAIKRRGKGFFNTAMSLVLAISIIYGMVFIGSGKSHSYSSEVMIDSLIEGEVELPGDKESFRIDTYKCPDNTAMFLNYSGINAFHSVVTPSIMEFYEFVGEQRNVASRPSTDNPALRTLLSVKYLLNLEGQEAFESADGTAKMAGYKYFDTQSGFKIYENENYVPYGFAYGEYISYEDCAVYTDKNRANVMLKAVVLEKEQIEKYKDVLLPFDTKRVYRFSNEELAEDAERLRESAAVNFTRENNKFISIINTDAPRLVFFSVPYSSGWTATVNGEAVEVEKANVGFMAVLVPAGESKIEFTYKTPYLGIGIRVSVGAAIVYALYLLICLLTRKNRREPYYPEGDKLIERYVSYDVADALEGIDVAEDGAAEEKKSSLDAIAEQLIKEYPVEAPKSEFTGGFKINIEDDSENA